MYLISNIKNVRTSTTIFLITQAFTRFCFKAFRYLFCKFAI